MESFWGGHPSSFDNLSPGLVAMCVCVCARVWDRLRCVASQVVVAPMSLHTGLVQAELTNAKVQVAAQNVSATGPGAYTGEVSAGALKDCGIGWALTGHSERRKAGETSAQTAAKTKAAVVGGLQVGDNTPFFSPP